MGEAILSGEKEVRGNYFYRARYYSPKLGRFISHDPLSGAEFSQGTNLYAYVSNDPINGTDPLGLITVGFYGAGGPSSGGNPDLISYLNGNAYDRTQVSQALQAIKNAQASGDNSITIIGYSRGNDAALALAKQLGTVKINQLTFVDPVTIAGNPENVQVTSNVLHANDFYQQNPRTDTFHLPTGTNPYNGGQIINSSANYINDPLTPSHPNVNHLNIVNYLIQNNLILGSSK